MTDLSKRILSDYQKRKTTKQKETFRQLIQDELEKQQIPVTIDTDGKRLKTHNIIIGDLANSKIILTAHYDTAALLPVPNLLFPRNMPANILYAITLLIGIGLLNLLIHRLVGLFNPPAVIMSFLSRVLFLALIVSVLFGKANPHTANDNTSGVVTVLELLHANGLNQVCYVLFDHEEIGLVGSSRFQKKYNALLKDKLLINFDCVSDGHHLFLIQSKSAVAQIATPLQESFSDVSEKEVIFARSSNTLYPSDQINFRHYIGVMACHRKPLLGYYLSRVHTMRDVIFDETNIRVLTDGFTRFIHSQTNI